MTSMPDPLSFPDLETARDRWAEIVGRLDTDLIRAQRWFQGRNAASVQLMAVDHAFLPWTHPEELVGLSILRAMVDGEAQHYFLPLILLPERPGLPAVARLTVRDAPYTLAEASLSRRVNTELLGELAAGNAYRGQRGSFSFHPVAPGLVRAVRPLDGDSSNTVLHLHRDEVQKIMRRLWPGPSREVRIGMALRDQPFIPAIHGHLSYDADEGPVFTLAIWQEYLPNKGSLWDVLVNGLTEILRQAVLPGQPLDPGRILVGWLGQLDRDLQRLGTLAARLHAALAFVEEPEPFTGMDLEPILNRIRAHLTEARAGMATEPPEQWTQAADLAGYLAGKLTAVGGIGQKIQTHGDFHLGQILLTDEGYVVLDLEGEPLLDPAERAARTSPLRDLAGLVRSFSYASQASYLALVAGQRVAPEAEATARFVASRFAERASEAVIRHYGAEIHRLAPALVPEDAVAFMDLLDLCRLEKVVYELTYELANRPEWVVIPLAGLRSMLAQKLGAGVKE
ncbi:MAG: phosphotransferase [Patescibacteria group bacterium]